MMFQLHGISRKLNLLITRMSFSRWKTCVSVWNVWKRAAPFNQHMKHVINALWSSEFFANVVFYLVHNVCKLNIDWSCVLCKLAWFTGSRFLAVNDKIYCKVLSMSIALSCVSLTKFRFCNFVFLVFQFISRLTNIHTIFSPSFFLLFQ